MSSVAADIVEAVKAKRFADAEALISDCSDVAELKHAANLIDAIKPKSADVVRILNAIEARIRQLTHENDGGGAPPGGGGYGL